ncbi:hypothetical protein P43SY_003848 [Pythium insidiosum]|uniref:Uncharacterized protein n=1 Tax=Pythium insidiosum TaxID=114742 RepID=A0AAD5Q3C2_PYTIN|nr:hypothetical protein P43SY_003848 [Pythium insidiosum]
MATAEEVEALKREVELLRQLLHNEHQGSGGAARERTPRQSTSLPHSPVKSSQDVYFSASKPHQDDMRRESSPRRPMTASSPMRGKSIRWKDAPLQSSQQRPTYPNRFESSTTSPSSLAHNNFVPIESKRGKWWLKDRQILSRNVPSPSEQMVSMKVRETWQWSGRNIVIDKIVSLPRSREEEHEDEVDERDLDHRNRELQDQASRYREELRRMGSSRKSLVTPTPSFSSSTQAAQATYHDSKELAKEFIQPKSPSNPVVEELSESMRTASQRMEAEMAKAASAGSNGGGGEGERAALESPRDHVDPANLLPSRPSSDAAHPASG